MKRSPLRRTSALAREAAKLRARRRPAVGTVDQREVFKLAVCHEEACCGVVDDGPHDGGLAAHHVISQQALRGLARQLGWDAETLAQVLWDPRNGLAVCRRHHDRHTLARRRLPLYLLGPAHGEFAVELGLDHLVVSTYRTRRAAA